MTAKYLVKLSYIKGYVYSEEICLSQADRKQGRSSIPHFSMMEIVDTLDLDHNKSNSDNFDYTASSNAINQRYLL